MSLLSVFRREVDHVGKGISGWEYLELSQGVRLSLQGGIGRSSGWRNRRKVGEVLVLNRSPGMVRLSR